MSIVHNHAFRETLLDFARTRARPAPPESAPEWEAWNKAFSEAFRAVIASVDHYCAVRVLDSLLAAQAAWKEDREA
jgi:hypothetical protein